jgi:hypothetical protein
MGNETKKMDDRDLEQVASSDAKDNQLVAVTTAASQRLPFSKARSIALVATVAAAPFLTVGILAAYDRVDADARYRPSMFRPQSLHFLRSAKRSAYPLVDSNGSSQPTTSRLAASWYANGHQIVID